MSGEMLAGQDTPAAEPSEVQNLSPEQQTGNPEPQTDGGEGESKSPAPEKVFTQAELDAILARERAKAERRAFREARQHLQTQIQPPRQEQTPSDGEQPQEQPQQPRFTKADIEAYLATQRAEEAKATFLEKLEDATDRFPDILTVVSDPRLPFTEQVIEFLADSDVGVEMAHRLAKNPKEFLSIVQMPELKAGRELSRIEAELKAKPKATPSRAPDPINPVGSRGAARSSPLPSDDDDIDTWMRKEAERTAKRGR